ncbi:hypothetical protein M6B38_365610 [Iris pallida]|uniref:Uncharacterized protein n=1 Tax=Iris pallida TaxID=29817 RepID=A0AAX6GHG5_IRIPA|nr:hypothetical protein M6B38_365610 [Iris pallida]
MQGIDGFVRVQFDLYPGGLGFVFVPVLIITDQGACLVVWVRLLIVSNLAHAQSRAVPVLVLLVFKRWRS